MSQVNILLNFYFTANVDYKSHYNVTIASHSDDIDLVVNQRITVFSIILESMPPLELGELEIDSVLG